MNMNVLIATHARSRLLQRTLESLAEARRPAELRSIIVVENGPAGGAEQVCAALRDRLPVQYHHRPPQGKTPALQWAIDNLIADGLVVFFDDDVRVAPRLLEAYAAAARAQGDHAYFGGPVDADYEQPPPDWLIPYLPPSASGWRPADPSDEEALRFIGTNYAVPVEGIRAIGGFDLRLGAGDDLPPGEESDMQQRLRRRGYKPCYVPDAVVRHFVPAERCSPQWTLHRKRRGAVGVTMNDPVFAQGRCVAGAPIWLWATVARRWLWARLMRLHPDARRRFEAAWPLAIARGRLDGVRFAHRQKSADGPADGSADHLAHNQAAARG